MKVVLDTNVIVSGFLKPFSPSGSLVQFVAEGMLSLAYDARILAEYHEVLKRPKFGLEGRVVDDFLTLVQAEGYPVTARPLPHSLPDRSDEPFLEVALASQASALVTGNVKHFPPARCLGMAVLSPREFHDSLRKE